MDIPFRQIVAIDIETVSQYASHNTMPERWQELWEHKIRHQIPEEETPESYYSKRSAILAEFGKIICISIGYFHFSDSKGTPAFRIKSVYGHQEGELLQAFVQTMAQVEKHLGAVFLAGHNIREFDIPYLSRRMMVHGVALPDFMDHQQKKPWEVNVFDTFGMWKFGDYKNFTSLDLLAACLEVPSPKTDLDGSKVGEVYWAEGDLERIRKYCEQDVLTVAQVLLRFAGRPLLAQQQIHFT